MYFHPQVLSDASLLMKGVSTASKWPN